MFKPNRTVAKYEKNALESIGDSLNNNYNRFKNLTSKHVYRSKSGKYRIHKVVKTVDEFKLMNQNLVGDAALKTKEKYQLFNNNSNL